MFSLWALELIDFAEFAEMPINGPVDSSYDIFTGKKLTDSNEW